MNRVKVTLTLDKNLVGQLDQLSKVKEKNRSRLVEEAINRWYQSELEQELIAGYRSMAQEDKETAEKNLSIALEAFHE